MGDELGLYGGNDPDNRRDIPAWAWTAADRATSAPPAAMPNAQATFAYVQRLTAIRRARAALAEGGYRELWRPNGHADRNVLSFLREGGGEALVLVANGGATGTTLSIPLQGWLADGTTLDDLLAIGAPATVKVTTGALTLTLPAKAAALYQPR
jgi:glycosidase